MKTILWPNEMSALSTGYSKYGREVIKRLHNTGKYKIYELACYGEIVDNRFNFPWGYYGNLPDPRNEEEKRAYVSNPINAFGLWRFNDAVLDCRPDVVMDIRDDWMCSFQLESPFRKFYNILWMPTVDAEPQDEPWIDNCSRVDGVNTYSDFGFNTLKKQGTNRIKLFKTASPAVDKTIFKPVPNRQQYRQSLGFSKDIFVVGTVMRNQKRKLYPDLIDSFALFLKTCVEQKREDLANKSYLYLHTSHPDIGWDIPRLIKNSGIGHKILLTYRCVKCGHVFPSYFVDSVTICRMCGNKSAGLPSTKLGVSEEALAGIYNIFDVYVQYAICEGFGMPMVEAAACGVPVFATDYSAMSDVVRKLKGIPISVQRMFYESESHRKFALPDNKDFVEKLIAFANLENAIKQKRCMDARLACDINYSWDRTAKVWEDLIDNTPNKTNKYNEKPSIHQPPNNYPKGLDNESFVNWCYKNVLAQPERIGDYQYMKLIKDLIYEAVLLGRGGMVFNDASTASFDSKWVDFNQEVCFNVLKNKRDEINFWEAKRVGMVNTDKPMFVRLSKGPQNL